MKRQGARGAALYGRVSGWRRNGYLAWPKGGSGGKQSSELQADSLLGEAMALRPIVLMAAEMRDAAALRPAFAVKADGYLRLAEQVFEKWDARHCWREVGDGGVWVVPPFGIEPGTDRWTEGHGRRMIARWLVAMHDVTKKPGYRERAERWWRVMRARMELREGRYSVWNYWDPAGPWDARPDGSPKHWIGVHPNGGYYAIDVRGIVSAHEHGLVFTREDLDRLIVTNRDFMWNQQVQGARFRRIDGGPPDPRWKDSPGVLWTALVSYDATLRRVFEANHDPGSWGGLRLTPWYVIRRKAAGSGQPSTHR